MMTWKPMKKNWVSALISIIKTLLWSYHMPGSPAPQAALLLLLQKTHLCQQADSQLSMRLGAPWAEYRTVSVLCTCISWSCAAVRDETEFRFSCRINRIGYILMGQLKMETGVSLLIPIFVLFNEFYLISTQDLWIKSSSILGFVEVWEAV